MLTKLKVQNYRSLKDTEVSFGPLTVLIGANGSGKSNILDVLRLVKEVTVEGTGTAQVFGARGGYREVVWGGESERAVSIEINWAPKGKQKTSSHRYAAEFRSDWSVDSVFVKEELDTPLVDTLRRTERRIPVLSVDGTDYGAEV